MYQIWPDEKIKVRRHHIFFFRDRYREARETQKLIIGEQRGKGSGKKHTAVTVLEVDSRDLGHQLKTVEGRKRHYLILIITSPEKFRYCVDNLLTFCKRKWN